MRSPVFLLYLLTAGIVFAGTRDSSADIQLDDDFDDNVLGTNTLGSGGGFILTDNGFTPVGSDSESDSQSKIIDGGVFLPAGSRIAYR